MQTAQWPVSHPHLVLQTVAEQSIGLFPMQGVEDLEGRLGK